MSRNISDIKAMLPGWLTHPSVRRWLVHKDKVPYYCKADGQNNFINRKGKLDTPEDLSQLSNFDEALSFIMQYPNYFTGLGFALGPDGKGFCYQGIDLDHIDTNLHLSDLLTELPQSYAEYSPSGKGVHIIGYGEEFKTSGSNGSGVEAYSKARFFTFTGNVLKTALQSMDLTDFVVNKCIPLHEKYNKKKTTENKAASAEKLFPVASILIHSEVAKDLIGALQYIPADDYHLWIEIGMALFSLGEEGFSMWKEWSAKSDRYEEDCCEERWLTFKPASIDYRAIFNRAKENGWKNPLTKHDPKIIFAKPEGWRFELPNVFSSFDPINGSRFKIIPAACFINFPPIQWLIKGILPQAELAMAFGESGSGKSFLVLDLACAIAQGILWCGRKTRQGRVVYIAAEGGGGMRKRIIAYQNHRKVDLERIPLDFISSAPDLMKEEDVSKLAESIGKATLIVIDTLACCNSGDENSAQDMNIVLSNCKKLHALTGATILLVHHSGKDITKGARGSSTLRGAMDCMIEITRKIECRFATIAKQKDGADNLEIPFNLEVITLGKDEDDELVTSCVIKYGEIQINTHKESRRYGKWEESILTAIHRMGTNNRALRDAIINEVINKISNQSSGKRNQSRATLNRSLNGLIDKGLIVVDGDYLIKM